MMIPCVFLEIERFVSIVLLGLLIAKKLPNSLDSDSGKVMHIDGFCFKLEIGFPRLRITQIF